MARLTSHIDRLVVPPAPRRNPGRRMTPDEKADWEAVDRWAREVAAVVASLNAWVQEVQTKLES